MADSLLQFAINQRADFPTAPPQRTQEPATTENILTVADVRSPKLNGQLIGSLVYRNAAASDGNDTITTPGMVTAAPAAYDQPYEESQRTAINTLIAAVNALAAELHDAKDKLRAAGIIAP